MGHNDRRIDRVTLPSGKYYVGDPCYAFKDHGEWMRWLEASDYKNNQEMLSGEIDGIQVVGIGTAYGDGEYFDYRTGTAFGVDAGLIGAVPSLWYETHGPSTDELRSLGAIVDFHDAFDCIAWPDGVIEIGHFQIPTGDETLEPEEEEEAEDRDEPFEDDGEFSDGEHM